MQVRIFKPTEDDHNVYVGEDFDFDVLPAVHQTLRFSAEPDYPFEVERVGFIQDGKTFGAAIWLRTSEPSDIDIVID
jgi:hypothetical protein